MEEFKDIPGHEGRYQINKNGEIKTLNYKRTGQHKLMVVQTDGRGYKCIGFTYNGKTKFQRIHRLLMLTFIGESDLQVNHIDGNKLNNKLVNLEYCTSSQNRLHAIHILGQKNNFQTNHPHKGKFGKLHNASKLILQYDLQGNFIKEWGGGMEIYRELGISSTNISECCSGKRKTSNGFIWKFKNKYEGTR